MVTEKMPKNAENYGCDICDFKCSKKSNYTKHLSTHKHVANASGDRKNADFLCELCKKKYKSRNGLWKHFKMCAMSINSENNPNVETSAISLHVFETTSSEIKILTNLVLEMVKNNTELQKQNTEIQKRHNELQQHVLDVCKTTTSINNSHINSHNNNKTFNLQFFLNEQCKDAMNMSDFVNTFELQLADLECVGDLGYVEGISKIIVERLNNMDIYKRPMHCSDAKRETLYIKDEDKWEKEEKNNPKLRKAIQTVSFKNMKLVTKWSDTYPESKNGESRMNDRYMKLIKQSTGGNGETADNEDKIIRRIAKEIVIEK